MLGRFNKFPYAMVFPKITNITVKNDILIGTTQQIPKQYERKMRHHDFNKMNEKYFSPQNNNSTTKTYEKLYRKKV